ncbi:sugar phosphate permease [Novosphingobium sp. PhB165]|nr:sugar phosphate permease [Novosphingobium sp. PhB165]
MSVAAEAPRKFGWYHGWTIVAIATLAQVASNGMPVNAFTLFVVDWSSNLNTPVSTLQLAIALLGLGSAILAPFAGGLADKVPARTLLVTGLGLVALFHVAIGAIFATWQFLALYGVVLPLGMALSTSVITNTLVSRWFVRRRGLALAVTSFGLSGAGVVLPPIIAALLPLLQWRMLWMGAGTLIGLVMLPLAFWLVRDRPTEEDGLHYVSAPGDQPVSGAAAHVEVHWREVFRRRTFWIVVATYLPLLGLWGGVNQNLGPIASSRGLDQSAVGLLLSLFSGAQLGSTLLMGLLSDRFGNRRPLAMLAVIAATGGIITALGQGMIGLASGIVLVGMGGGLWPLIASAIANEFGAAASGRAFGLTMAFLPIMAFAPFAIAKTHEMSGSYVPGLIGIAIVTLVGGGICLLMKE